MSADTESNKKCAVCNGYLFDDDDVVICPACGAPHHRDCYKTVGHCGLEELHGTEDSYDKVKKREEEAEKSGKTCRYCGKTSESDNAKFCQFCGKPYENGGRPFTEGRPFMPGDRFTVPTASVNPDGKIGDVSEKEAVQYLGISSVNYLPKFRRLSPQNKKSWNWAAFIFPGTWCLSRKMYPNGIVCVLASIISSLCTLPINRIVEANCISFTYEEILSFLMNNCKTIGVLPLLLPFVGLALTVVPRIIAALFGDWWYKNNVVSRIKMIKEEAEGVDLDDALAHDGAINALVMLGALFCEAFLPDLLLNLLL